MFCVDGDGTSYLSASNTDLSDTDNDVIDPHLCQPFPQRLNPSTETNNPFSRALESTIPMASGQHDWRRYETEPVEIMGHDVEAAIPVSPQTQAPQERPRSMSIDMAIRLKQKELSLRQRPRRYSFTDVQAITRTNKSFVYARSFIPPHLYRP